MRRAIIKRFNFDYEYYDSDLLNERMLHIKIFTEGLMQVDLWLDKSDQEKLRDFLNNGGKNE